ncbi:putative leucine-rich repeat-containing, plant-type, leucine-rich repeat domain superfamily [Helianthus annuus]|uniref:receptor-like protein 7 n=1 Tax=Helianthus annuus TaxID=4232 RepID=UPI000B900781|nr:receptor-like protein 7 [Helianthus annuus]KAJ0513062.1 putative leucine-rich repeat-containing, plant-type, leucine-rich repeat domain superfamily [Helianthus annuus]KAJ0529214.1 putative leucine-rich repeat-containing, plant-type, leucine-rich repeat domain superfamily [Helianthus annuus]KAJ0696094.1 putative leucine-rich repeat-containing, plant-type, leucine-rich repeat domain superfamily [Helianthus annuus]KAJ0878656.1 putative leucine-rich repeat-containing, plant-type, leucine-rich re
MKPHLFFHIFFIPFYLILLSVSGQCQSDQQSVLIQLKNDLHFNSSLATKLVSWNPNVTDCCNWLGVTCSTTGQVIGLDLSNETISVGINDSSVLFGLQSLESLNLAANNFNFSQIPSRFGSFASLKNLNLSNSGFSGQIPGELSQLSSLEVLDLSSLFSFGTRSLGLENPNLATFVQNFTKLRGLYLDNVNISSQRFDWGQSLSSSLRNLEVLSLSNCQLSGPLDNSLENLRSLLEIRLALNNISAPVPDFFANFTNLTVMKLGSCNLLGTFPNKVLQLQNLQILDLALNKNLSGSLPDFPVNGSLQSLMLSHTNFSGGIPESIGNLKNLSRIELFVGNFSGPIPKSIQNLTQLGYIDLSSNNFTGQIPSFQMCKNLTHVDLSRNSLSGMIPSAHFQGLENLVYVDLGFNDFSGSIPSTLFTLQKLQTMQLSNNNFSGLLANFTNPSLSSLVTLDLSSNKLSGEIPRSIFELQKLSILLLSSNNLSGTIRTEDFQDRLSNLTTLDLSFNNFSIQTSNNITLVNHLPKFSTLKLASCNLIKFPNLRNQSKLVTLDLSSNKIEGNIPTWIWEVGNGSLSYMNLSRNRLTGLEEPYNFPDLFVLDLHSNLINGVIPIPPQTATFIDYSNNRFNLSLPEGIGGNLGYAYFFSVSNNALTGVIPQTICNAAYLKVLDMSNNRLNGSIPNCLIELGSSLGVLNLANNSLSGRIEGTFPSNCGLNTLDLHENLLEGKIPESLVNCTMLEVLNLGKNKINDTYPCSLSKNANLRVLVLRSNRLHGSVACGQTQHNNWSKLQIVDISSNYLDGEIPKNCFRQWAAMMNDDNGDPPKKKHLSFTVLQLSNYYYQDTVTVTVKGLELELVKILRVFTSIDISNNNFSGEIPRAIGQLKALYVLNVSRNAFTGTIPPSMGNLSQLESLDMSSNKLTGEIPYTLASLTFLSTLNLSNNQLKGRIPISNQFQTFENDSYLGNKELCGLPLTRNCPGSNIPTTENVPPFQESKNGYDWQFIFTGVGFGSGAAIVTAPIMLTKTGRYLWNDYTNKLVITICLVLGIRYAPCRLFEEDEDDEKETVSSDENSDDSEFESVADQSKGRYCVYCTKLDFSRKQAIHDAKCTCFDQTKLLSTSSSTSSSEAASPFTKL